MNKLDIKINSLLDNIRYVQDLFDHNSREITREIYSQIWLYTDVEKQQLIDQLGT